MWLLAPLFVLCSVLLGLLNSSSSLVGALQLSAWGRILAHPSGRKVRAQRGSFCWLVLGFMRLLVMASGPAQWCYFQGGLDYSLVPLMAPESTGHLHTRYFMHPWVPWHRVRCSHLTSSGGWAELYGLNCVLQPLKVIREALDSNMTVFGDRAVMEVIKFKWDHKGAWLKETDRYQGYIQRKGHVRRHLSACREARPTPWSWTSSLCTCEKINFCWWSHLVCSI